MQIKRSGDHQKILKSLFHNFFEMIHQILSQFLTKFDQIFNAEIEVSLFEIEANYLT